MMDALPVKFRQFGCAGFIAIAKQASMIFVPRFEGCFALSVVVLGREFLFMRSGFGWLYGWSSRTCGWRRLR